MSEEKTDSSDILAHLRGGNNPYVQSNAMANIPRKGSNNNKVSLRSRHKKHAPGGFPNWLNHKLCIFERDNDTLMKNPIWAKLKCINFALPIQNRINEIFKSNEINANGKDYNFGYFTTKKENMKKIESFNCRTNDIEWDILSHFCLQELKIQNQSKLGAKSFSFGALNYNDNVMNKNKNKNMNVKTGDKQFKSVATQTNIEDVINAYKDFDRSKCRKINYNEIITTQSGTKYAPFE